MNLISNYTDLTLLNMTGWSGSKDYDIQEGCLVLTATNGWRTFAWSIDSLPSDIVFEFDYKFINTENWSSCYVVNLDSIGYGSSIATLGKVTDKWTHLKVSISSPKKVIGINIRGVDNTGKSVTMLMRNPMVYNKSLEGKLSLLKEGILSSRCFNDCRGGDISSIGKAIVTMNDFIER